MLIKQKDKKMSWFIVDYEVSMLGKDMLVIEAPNKETAVQIAMKIVKKNNRFIDAQVQIVSVRERH